MKITFPYMGCVTGYKKMLEILGHEVIMPQKPTQHTFELGVKYSTEFVCYPFKVMLGTYIEGLERGAEAIVSSGGSGPCRAGLYGGLHEKILNEMGYNPKIFIFDSIFGDFKGFMENLKLILNNTPLYKFLYKLKFLYCLINQMDNMEKRINIIRGYEVNKGQCNTTWEKIKQMYDKCYNSKDLKITHKKAQEMLDAIPLNKVDEDKKIRVGIVGEIYVIMESSVNMEIEQKLNDMGIEVENVQYISEWLRHHMLPKKLCMTRSHIALKKAEKYVKINCGGHDKENIGWIVDFHDRGFDAVIHLMPFGCLPELVNQSIITNLSKELDLPVLTLSIDEQSGSTNSTTRLEAFVDLVKNKKFAKSKGIVLCKDLNNTDVTESYAQI